MAEIKAFKGIRYAGGGDISNLTAPPYDIISGQLQDELYEKSDKNIVRVEFGKTTDKDAPGDDRYSRSAAFLRGWLADGTLIREETPAIYLYSVEYVTPQGEFKEMTGFICLLKLEEWDNEVVLPHEGTLKGPKADRFDLFRATGAAASQIFSLFSDPAKRVTSVLKTTAQGSEPDAWAKDEDGAIHRMWVVKDAWAIKTVADELSAKKIFIADGHHRYETALAYRNHCREQGLTDGEFEYVPMFLANMDDPGITILPTHRLISAANGLTCDEVIKRASNYFNIEKLPFTSEYELRQRKNFLEALLQKGKRNHAFGVYFQGSPFYFLLTLKELDPVVEALRCKYSEAYCNLDVTILHELIIERVLGIDLNMIAETQPVKFEKDGCKAIERVKSGEFDACFLLNATKVREVKEIALAREIMPQKSTYFYPKLLTGLVIAELVPIK